MSRSWLQHTFIFVFYIGPAAHYLRHRIRNTGVALEVLARVDELNLNYVQTRSCCAYHLWIWEIKLEDHIRLSDLLNFKGEVENPNRRMNVCRIHFFFNEKLCLYYAWSSDFLIRVGTDGQYRFRKHNFNSTSVRDGLNVGCTHHRLNYLVVW